jgi:putative Mn2+ efflux pump MntP
LVRSANQIWFSFVVMLFVGCFLIVSQFAVCTVVGERRNLLPVERGCCSNRERSKNCDEELLITGVSVSEENQRVLNDGVSASWMK